MHQLVKITDAIWLLQLAISSCLIHVGIVGTHKDESKNSCQYWKRHFTKWVTFTHIYNMVDILSQKWIICHWKLDTIVLHFTIIACHFTWFYLTSYIQTILELCTFIQCATCELFCAICNCMEISFDTSLYVVH